MKKKIISLIIAFLCTAACFSGCELGSYIESGNKNPPGTSTNPGGNEPGGDNPGGETPDDTKTHYKVNVIYNNERFYPGDLDIYVVWRNEYSVVRYPLGADGTADAGELDGDFRVYLEGLPSKYAYNPNAYTATSDSRFVSILLTDIIEPANASRADGKNKYVNLGCYNLKYDGIYRAYLDGERTDEENGVLFYEYTPTAAGYYSIVSLVNVYDDDINPKIDIWGGTMAFKWYQRTLDGGGASIPGGYTKNFRYEVRISASEVGGSFTFAVHAASKTNAFPLYVDFEIKYEGDYTSSYENVLTKRAQERLYKAPDPKPNERFEFADIGTKQFSMNNFRFSDVDNRYHHYSMEYYADDPYGIGAGYGPALLCAITPKIPSYTVTTLYNANFVGLGSNYLKIFDCWIEELNAYGIYDYTEFIRTDYYGACNSYGYCYVTRELKEFLQLFAINQALFTDGMNSDTQLEGGATPEALGYYANEDSMWLFACGFYTTIQFEG